MQREIDQNIRSIVIQRRASWEYSSSPSTRTEEEFDFLEKALHSEELMRLDDPRKIISEYSKRGINLEYRQIK